LFFQSSFLSHPQVSDVLLGLTQQDDLVAAAQALGYNVKLRDCVGGGQGAQCLQNLRHSFLILSPSAHSSSSRGRYAEEVIIDPTFRDNFVIAHPSARYSAVLDALPLVFIGTLSKVQPLVEALCSEMALAFKAAGIVMPPWRSLRSMMTKWLPRRSLDLPLPTCPPAAYHATAATSASTASAPLRCAAVSTAAGQGLGLSAHQRAAATAAGGAGPMREDSTRWLRQACNAAEARGHSLAPSSSNSATINSASSSNCSSVSAGPPHAALLQASAGCESDPGSPAAPQPLVSKAAAVAPAGALPQQLAVPSHACGTRAGAGGLHSAAAACTATARHSMVCAEPLQRVVGGFGAFSFSNSPL
jgi:uncharacterized protein (TIGR01615 family)